jgi:hypothetical protein
MFRKSGKRFPEHAQSVSLRNRELQTMRYRSLAFAVATLSSTQFATVADAQSVYVAPGGIYVASGPVYVTPAPSYGAPPYAAPAPTYGAPPYATPGPAYAVPPYVAPAPGYASPAYLAPAPAYAAPAYVAPAPAYAAPVYVEREPAYREPAYVVRERRGPPLSAYAAELPPRPPVAVPYNNGGRCVVRSHYGHWEYCD